VAVANLQFPAATAYEAGQPTLDKLVDKKETDMALAA
jgi:hypothetical protein